MIRLYDYLLAFHTHRIGVTRAERQLIQPHRSALVLSFRTLYLQLTVYRPPADGVCYMLPPERWKHGDYLTQACINGPLLAQVYGTSCFGHITVLDLTTLYRRMWSINRSLCKNTLLKSSQDLNLPHPAGAVVITSPNRYRL